jgi:hypothetical protein
MSAVKISQLPNGVQLQSGDLVPISRGVENFSIQGNTIASSSQLQSLSSNLTTQVQSVSTTLTTYVNSLSSSNVNAVKRVFTGTGSQSVFALGLSNPSTNSSGYRVDIDGVVQEPGTDYTISNGNINFTTVPDAGTKIVVVTAEVLSTVSLSSNIVADNLTVNNLTVLSGININPIKLSFTGNGSQVSFALTGFTPSTNPNSYRIDIDGILQEPGTAYTISGGNLVFSGAPGNNTRITVITANILTTTNSNINISDWSSLYSTFTSSSAEWDSVYNTFTSSSAFYVQSQPTLETSTMGLSTVKNMVALKQATYNALTIKRPDTYYIIVP